jgi:aminopeptidase N
VPSLLRGFSAPVRMTVEGQTEDDLLRILRSDTDGFNRYESGQVLARRTILAAYHAPGAVADFAVPEALTAAYAAIAADERIDGAFKAFALTLPSRNEVIGAIPKCDPVRLHEVIVHIGKAIARALRPTLEAIIRAVPAAAEPYAFNAAAVAKRALVNRAFLLLAQLGDAGVEAQTMQRLQTASNMTDEAAMLNALNRDCPTRAAALAHFEGKWANEPLVYLKYMTVVAAAEVSGNIPAVKAIMEGPRFAMTNPNSVYSLLGGFMASAVNFHNADGSGYAFAADSLLAVDRLNPQAASRLIGQFAKYRAYDDARQALMRAQLERIVATAGISDNIREIAVKSLAS